MAYSAIYKFNVEHPSLKALETDTVIISYTTPHLYPILGEIFAAFKFGQLIDHDQDYEFARIKMFTDHFKQHLNFNILANGVLGNAEYWQLTDSKQMNQFEYESFQSIKMFMPNIAFTTEEALLQNLFLYLHKFQQHHDRSTSLMGFETNVLPQLDLAKVPEIGSQLRVFLDKAILYVCSISRFKDYELSDFKFEPSAMAQFNPIDADERTVCDECNTLFMKRDTYTPLIIFGYADEVCCCEACYFENVKSENSFKRIEFHIQTKFKDLFDYEALFLSDALDKQIRSELKVFRFDTEHEQKMIDAITKFQKELPF